MEIKHVKASEFNNEVLKADKPVLLISGQTGADHVRC